MCFPELSSFVKGSVRRSHTSPVLACIDQFCHMYLQQVIRTIFPHVLHDILEMAKEQWANTQRNKKKGGLYLTFFTMCIATTCLMMF